jgi:hypothetical protein
MVLSVKTLLHWKLSSRSSQKNIFLLCFEIAEVITDAPVKNARLRNVWKDHSKTHQSSSPRMKGSITITVQQLFEVMLLECYHLPFWHRHQ